MTRQVGWSHPKVQLHPPLIHESGEIALNGFGLRRPDAYRQFLRSANGARSIDGFFRIFGIGETPGIDGLKWNATETWKFAWPRQVSEFWCFGETAWGDQYAFELNSSQERVFFLDAVAMQPEVINQSFAEFYNEEFLRNVESPYDEMTRKAQERFGRLDEDVHLIHSPSILISQLEDIEAVKKMPSVAAMILNGDLFSQMGAEEQERTLREIETFVDDHGRTRIRVRWREP